MMQPFILMIMVGVKNSYDDENNYFLKTIAD